MRIYIIHFLSNLSVTQAFCFLDFLCLLCIAIIIIGVFHQLTISGFRLLLDVISSSQVSKDCSDSDEETPQHDNNGTYDLDEAAKQQAKDSDETTLQGNV